MQHLLTLRCLWQARHAILGGLAYGKFGARSKVVAVAGRSLGLGDRLGILSVHAPAADRGALHLLTSFDRWVQGIHISAAGYTIAGYPLDGEDPKQFSGGYRLKTAVPI